MKDPYGVRPNITLYVPVTAEKKASFNLISPENNDRPDHWPGIGPSGSFFNNRYR
jgi:hypothetical protein